MDLDSIETALASAIGTMSIAGGYNFEWTSGTVNPTNCDWNRVAEDAYPIADIYCSGEDCENPEQNTLTNSYIAEFLIDVIPNKGSVTSQNVKKCVSDIKRLCGQNPTLSGNCFFAWYVKFRKFSDQMHYPEYGARITLKVRYTQLRSDP